MSSCHGVEVHGCTKSPAQLGMQALKTPNFNRNRNSWLTWNKTPIPNYTRSVRQWQKLLYKVWCVWFHIHRERFKERLKSETQFWSRKKKIRTHQSQHMGHQSQHMGHQFIVFISMSIKFGWAHRTWRSWLGFRWARYLYLGMIDWICQWEEESGFRMTLTSMTLLISRGGPTNFEA